MVLEKPIFFLFFVYLMLFDWIASGIVPENVADLLNGSFDEVIYFFSTSV